MDSPSDLIDRVALADRQTLLQRTMYDAQVQLCQFDEVVLVDSAGYMPLVARMVSRTFDRLPLCHVNLERT
jgi:molecular chaperone DnaK (HSP70)